MNREQRRALARMKPGRAKQLPRVHHSVVLADALPTPTADTIVVEKLKLIEGIAALKDGRFKHAQLCQFHDFVSLGLRFCDQYRDERLRDPINQVATALIGIMERHTERGIYSATGDELRTLQSWVEEICDYLGSFPELSLKCIRADLAQEELALRVKLLAKG